MSILFMDELHTMIGAGGAEGAMDASGILKPALSRGELRLIGATTIAEYRKYIEKDAALERRFQPITVEEPTKEQCTAILEGLKTRYEAHHHVTIRDEAVRATVELSERYITDRNLPDKAIDVLDEACSKVGLKGYQVPEQLMQLEELIKSLIRQKEDCIREGNFTEAALLQKEQEEALKKFRNQKKRLEKKNRSAHPEVGASEDRGSCFRMDKDPGAEIGGKRCTAPAEIGKDASQTRHRAGRGSQRCCPGSQAGTRRIERSETTDRFILIPRTDRRRKDRIIQGACGDTVRKRRFDDPGRYVRIYGETFGGEDDRIPSGICGT